MGGIQSTASSFELLTSASVNSSGSFTPSSISTIVSSVNVNTSATASGPPDSQTTSMPTSVSGKPPEQSNPVVPPPDKTVADASPTIAAPTTAMNSSADTSANVSAQPASPVASPSPSKPATAHSSDPTHASMTIKPNSSGSTHVTAKSTGIAGVTKAPASSTGRVASTTTIDTPVLSFTGTKTSTITDAPDSTLSKPSLVSFVDSNGKTSFGAAPLVTILSTSMEPNGSFVTLTHVVANPTGFSQDISGGHASFFNNEGAVAGVFLVVGAIVTSIVAFTLFVLCRRSRRRQEAHRRWLISMNRPRPLPDEDPFTPSAMRSFDRPWDGASPARSLHQDNSTGLGLYGVPPMRRVDPPTDYIGHYDKAEPVQAGLTITTTSDPKPSAQSSPSIYPPSLPPANEGHEIFEEFQPPPVPVAPPRPRRSHLRDSASKTPLITPPSSVSSHSPISEFAGPFGFTPADGEQSTFQHGGLQLNEIIGRRTLLDVRPRSQESVDWNERR